MKMALTVALHARPNPLCIDRARDDLQPVQPGEKLSLCLTSKYSPQSVWMGRDLSRCIKTQLNPNLFSSIVTNSAVIISHGTEVING